MGSKGERGKEQEIEHSKNNLKLPLLMKADGNTWAHFECSFYLAFQGAWGYDSGRKSHLLCRLKIRAYLLRLGAFAKFGTPSISVVFCPIRLLIGLWGEERETDPLECHIRLLFAFSKGSISSYCSWRQIIQLLTGPQRINIAFQRFSFNNLASQVQKVNKNQVLT